MYGKSDVPGPGSYEASGSTNLSPGRLGRFGTSQRPGISRLSPGPGAYGGDASGASMKQGKASFGTAHRRIHSSTDIPGPGSYETNLSGRAPAYSLKPRQEPLNKNAVPGPGSYMQDLNTVGSKKNFKFGTGTRPNRLSDIPGPGSYDS
jgi:hypothetical protein